MANVNVCFLHNQGTKKWTWFLADEHGRSLLKRLEEKDSYDEAKQDYDDNRAEYEAKLIIT